MQMRTAGNPVVKILFAFAYTHGLVYNGEWCHSFQWVKKCQGARALRIILSDYLAIRGKWNWIKLVHPLPATLPL